VNNISEFHHQLQIILDSTEWLDDLIHELFGEDSDSDGLFSERAKFLHQFNILSSCFHQLNSIQFLTNSNDMIKQFNKEINTANYRTIDYKNKAIKTIQKKNEKLKDYSEKLLEGIIKIQDNLDIIDQLNELEVVDKTLSFYLHEVLEHIMQPAYSIISAELEAADKIGLLISNKEINNKKISEEEIARLCELLSWGLEGSSGWVSIRNEMNRMSVKLQLQITQLKNIISTK